MALSNPRLTRRRRQEMVASLQSFATWRGDEDTRGQGPGGGHRAHLRRGSDRCPPLPGDPLPRGDAARRRSTLGGSSGDRLESAEPGHEVARQQGDGRSRARRRSRDRLHAEPDGEGPQDQSIVDHRRSDPGSDESTVPADRQGDRGHDPGGRLHGTPRKLRQPERERASPLREHAIAPGRGFHHGHRRAGPSADRGCDSSRRSDRVAEPDGGEPESIRRRGQRSRRSSNGSVVPGRARAHSDRPPGGAEPLLDGRSPPPGLPGGYGRLRTDRGPRPRLVRRGVHRGGGPALIQRAGREDGRLHGDLQRQRPPGPRVLRRVERALHVVPERCLDRRLQRHPVPGQAEPASHLGSAPPLRDRRRSGQAPPRTDR
jgi:hypothetical protein